LNYFEKHIGDYLKEASHLSLLEHGVYSRLRDVYYTLEGPIPDDQAARKVGARSREERDALLMVLQEFFTLVDGHWHHAKWAEDIAVYQAGEPEREVKKANEDNRTKRHREERARLFKVITDAGLHAPWNIGMTELRAMAADVISGATPGQPATQPVTAPDTPPATPVTAPATLSIVPATQPVTAPATPVTATHSPFPIPHSPVVKPPHPPRGEGRFAEFWEAWPRSHRKGGRAECVKVWAAKGLDSQADAILSHVRAMRGSPDWTKEAGQFIPAPVVYLRAARWDGADVGELGTSASPLSDIFAGAV